jgi:hypothetical protein
MDFNPANHQRDYDSSPEKGAADGEDDRAPSAAG